MSISTFCLVQHLHQHHKEALIWEGNYWDGDCHDYAELTRKTVAVVVCKISKILEKQAASIIASQDKEVLLLLPNVIQLPFCILACELVRLKPIILNPSDPKLIDILGHLFKERKINLIITLDAFWQGEKLVRTKEILDDFLEKNESEVSQIFLVRHCAANEGVPPPEVEYPGRRPSYKVKFPLKEGRDYEWSQLMREMSMEKHEDLLDELQKQSECPVSTSPDDVRRGILAILPNWINNHLQSQIVTVGDVLDGFEKLAELRRQSCKENFETILPLGHAQQSLFHFCALLFPWYIGSTLVQYEGIISYPDHSRLSHIIRKYEVTAILLSPELILDPEYLSFVPTNSLRHTILGKMETTDNADVADDDIQAAEILSLAFPGAHHSEILL